MRFILLLVVVDTFGPFPGENFASINRYTIAAGDGFN